MRKKASSQEGEEHEWIDDNMSIASNSDVESLALIENNDTERSARNQLPRNHDDEANKTHHSDEEASAHSEQDDVLSNPPSSADEQTDQASEKSEAYRPVRLHATTSRFDDWLHRGPWLHSIPYHLYIHDIMRVRKSSEYTANEASSRFKFDEHYPLSALYEQQMGIGVVPRLVGPKCSQYEGKQKEDYCLWHLALFGLARCPGAGSCCEVSMFKNMLCSTKPPPSRQYSFIPTWNARRHELTLLSERGRAKVEESQRIPTIFDTSLVKQWNPAGNGKPIPSLDISVVAQEEIKSRRHDSPLHRIIVLQVIVGQLGQWNGQVFSLICDYMNITTGYHDHQLHMEEYCAIRCIEAISNINFQLLVEKKHFEWNTNKPMTIQKAMLTSCLTINHVGKRQSAWAEIKMMMSKTKNTVQK